MKRFLITICALLCAALLVFGCYYIGGVYIDVDMGDGGQEPGVAVRTQQDRIQLLTGEGWQDFELHGVNLGSSMPGEWSTDYAIDQETYLRWFEQMQEMGVNVVRVYSIQNPAFYQALKVFNEGHEQPIYLLQGVWVNDYAQNSHMDAFDSAFCQRLTLDCKAAVDVLHGERFVLTNDAGSASGVFRSDVSKWVLGYIVGAEWTDVTVAYTDEKYPDMQGYEGSYLSTSPDASPFETMLAQVGDALIAYETQRYGQQRLVSFANTRITDPFDYPQDVAEFFRKCASIDAEHIVASERFEAGLFASYSCYSYDLDFLAALEPSQWPTLTGNAVDFSDCNGENGQMDTYLAYLKLLNAHHTMPVVVMEFGAASGRGLAQSNTTTSLREGHFSESEQAEAILACWQDIVSSGCSGGCVFSWQDEWNKRTWNTMFSVDLSRNPYWSDAQSSDQHFGLLAFDPGKESVCVVDGEVSEWSDADVAARYDDGSSVSLKYDERYIYLYVHKPGYCFGGDTLYLPIDTTSKTGTTLCPDYDLSFDRAVDFLVVLHGAQDSCLMVQDRYHAIHANFELEITGQDAYLDPPAKDSTHFEVVQMAVKDAAGQYLNVSSTLDAFESGMLRLGNADPDAPDYDSLTDFAVRGEDIEIRLPWALLNFSDPSRMQIHDDYYDGNYGVQPISIRRLYVGLGTRGQTIQLGSFRLKGWGNHVTWHERLKPAYYALKACWTGGEEE